MKTMKSQFYYIHGEDSPQLGVAYAPAGLDEDLIPADAYVTSWSPVRLSLLRGTFTDILGCDLIWRLCSARMREAIDAIATPRDGIQWLKVLIEDEHGHEQPYFVLHVPRASDVLDPERTIFDEDGQIRRAVLDSTKARGSHVLRLPGDTFRRIVSLEVRRSLETARCLGLIFSPVPQTP